MSIHRKRRIRQHELVFRSWGGARRGAGRKPANGRAGVPHATRPELSARHPVHVTVRLRKGLPNLRCEAARRVLERTFRAGAERFGFRLVHHSIQGNHLHFIAEARDRRALSRGMRGLMVRIARSLNLIWRRSGSVVADRYHARCLKSPREVRHALVYVLRNACHHGLRKFGIDPYSSGGSFDGWARPIAITKGPGVAATSWLLRVGWRIHGLIRAEEVPRSATQDARSRLKEP